MDQVKVQVMFTVDTRRGKYQDALYFDRAVYDSLDPNELERLKQERVDKWLRFIDESSTAEPVEPTKEQLEEESRLVDEQIEQLQFKKTEINTAISARINGK